MEDNPLQRREGLPAGPEEPGGEELRPAPPADPSPILRPAGFIRRAIAFVIDMMILGFLYLLLVLAGFLGARLSLSGASPPPSSEMPLPSAVPFVTAWFFLYTGYFTFFHSNSGQTPAKMIIRIKVVSAGGDGLSVARSLLRSLGYFFSSLFFGFGFFLAIFERKKRGLHDFLANTLVVLS